MSQLIRLDDRAKVLEGVFRTNMAAMAKVVPRTMGDPSRLLRIAYNNVAYDTALLECSATPQGMASIFGGVMEALKLGLSIGGPMQEAWLIPFKHKGVPLATLIIGYQGFRNILDRGKSVIDLHPVAVRANDEFDFELGTRPYVKHKPKLGDRGELIAVYAVAHLPRGGIQIEVMGKAEVDEHRAKSRAGQAGPWVDFYEAMALKTVVRKIAKYLPKSSEILARALDLDDRADRGVDQNYDLEGMVFDMGLPPVKQVGGTRLDVLKKELHAGKPAPPPAPVVTLAADVLVDEPDAPADCLTDALFGPDAELTPDQKRVMDERAEIERYTAKMKETEDKRPVGFQRNFSGGFEPAFSPTDDAIGPERAAVLMEKIRQNGAKKAKERTTP